MIRERVADLVGATQGLRKRLVGRSGGGRLNSETDLEGIREICRIWQDKIAPSVGDEAGLAELDMAVRALWDKTFSNGRVSAYVGALDEITRKLRALAKAVPGARGTRQDIPELKRLVSDPALRANLEVRWKEIELGLSAGTYLASTVMMGSVLEGLLIARMRLDQAAAMKSARAPKEYDEKKKKSVTKTLDAWMLNDLIGVAEEQGWINQVASEASKLLRDWRNLIHPNAQLRRGVSVGSAEAVMLWVVCGAIATDLVRGLGRGQE